MNRDVFLINDRFRIYPALNQVEDRQTGHTIRLEPRVMAVLEMLSGRAGQLVRREEMIREIWHNYGGGDEALSQAVSILRKTLADSEKKLIQTIPKKGYRLKGFSKTNETARAKPALRQLARFALLLYVIGTTIYFLYGGLYQQQQVIRQQVASFTTVVAPTSVKKSVRYTHNRKPAANAHRLENADHNTPVLPKSLASRAAEPPGSPIIKYYHSSDTTAQMITSLDYRVSTQVQIHTTLN